MTETDFSPLNGASPWWFKTLWVIGPATVIALGLVYIGAIQMAQDTRLTRENLLLHHQYTEQLYRNIDNYMRVQNLLLQQLCVNSATNADQRTACFKQ